MAENRFVLDILSRQRYLKRIELSADILSQNVRGVRLKRVIEIRQ